MSVVDSALIAALPVEVAELSKPKLAISIDLALVISIIFAEALEVLII